MFIKLYRNFLAYICYQIVTESYFSGLVGRRAWASTYTESHREGHEPLKFADESNSWKKPTGQEEREGAQEAGNNSKCEVEVSMFAPP